MNKTIINPITCGGCPKVWTGVNRAHCPVCHITFGGPTAFTNHRRYNKCMSLERIETAIEAGGLGLADNGKGVWTSSYGGEDEDSSDLS